VSWVTSANAALLTDLYELTMAASYHRRGINGRASFDLFVRKLPERRNFLVACGLEQALDYLETLRFDEDALAYLRSLEMFPEEFLAFLGNLRFTGDVHAVPEGEIVFGGEPFLRVTAPLIEAQIVETFLLNCVIFQTMIASKAARVAIACGSRRFVDFSPRRDHAGRCMGSP
jgi:nicotinate phosphoribosyltransferase